MKKISIIFALCTFLLSAAFFAIAEEPTTNLPPAEVPQVHDVGNVGVSDPTVIQGIAALAKWDVAAADRVAEQLKKEGKWDSKDVVVFRARLKFFHGDYAACDELNNILQSKFQIKDSENFYQRVKKLAGAMNKIKSFDSAHFTVRVMEGPDEILVYDALDALEKAYRVLSADLKIKPTSKIILEVFPTFESFEFATGLTKENVETSGTVAVCKYARLMITSPRELLRGYSWRDTVSHEFAHYLIFLHAGYNCPIWLHEGIAKYEEKRWREVEGGWLSPVSQSLLAAALKADNLITFEEMNPSFAMLPSATAGQLAFAEVTMAVKYLVSRGGFDLVFRLLDRLSKDPDYQKAIKAELGESYSVFFGKFKKYLWSAKLEEIPGVDIVGVKIRKSGEETPENEEFDDEIGRNNPARKYARLGELLQAEGREAAALIEYKKALGAQPNSMYLINKTAYLMIRQNDADSAIPLLKKAEYLYPESSPSTYKWLGIAYKSKGDYQSAKQYFELSADINPFDHEVQSSLWKIYGELGLEDQRKEAERKLAILVPDKNNQTVK